MYRVVLYEDKYEEEWDKFIEVDSINGTFLQSRNFLNYHPQDRFIDSSFLIFKDNRLAAVIPGCTINAEGKKVFSSHAGSTFGGMVIHKKDYTASNVIGMLKTLESLLQDYGFGKILLKITPDIFAKERSDVLQYVLGYCGFTSYAELSCYIDFDNYNKNLSANFSHGQKENLKYASKNDMLFTIINSDEEICIFYDILKSNLLKFNVKPVHSVEELLDFKNNRLKNNIIFYGIFIENRMISGGMIFNFGTVMHTQYLATDYAYIKYRPMTFLYYKLIELAQQNGYRILSWGISTEERGTILNENLLTFKESFGSKYALNRGFYKTL